MSSTTGTTKVVSMTGDNCYHHHNHHHHQLHCHHRYNVPSSMPVDRNRKQCGCSTVIFPWECRRQRPKLRQHWKCISTPCISNECTLVFSTIVIIALVLLTLFGSSVESRVATQTQRHGKNQQSHHNVHSENNNFCTLENFQNCLSEFWPGGATATADNVNGVPPLDRAIGSGSNQRISKQHNTGLRHHDKHGHDSHDPSLHSLTLVSALSVSNSTNTPTSTISPLLHNTNSSSSSNKLDLAFPTTYQEMQVTCVDLKERVRCLDRHSERCFTPEMMQVFGHIVTNAKQFVHDLCDNKRVQSEFLIHAKCFRNISLDEQKCGQEYRDAMNIPVNDPSAVNTDTNAKAKESSITKRQSSGTPLAELLPNPAKLISAGKTTQQAQQEFHIKELIMRRSCCALQELVLCKRRHVREQCGESAAIFMRDHLPRITNPVLEQHCSAYTYGPGTCDEALYRRRIVNGKIVLHSHSYPFDHRYTANMQQQQQSSLNGDNNNRMTRNGQLSSLDDDSSQSENNTAAIVLCATNWHCCIVKYTLAFALLAITHHWVYYQFSAG